ncbi:DUF6527 family protein [Sulfitobacter pontiacus]|uniref:DUF6527 family protein n=1 Tax=Sulfitobacter pontiacus TaxID=60137 RepID=UPI002AC9CC2F|nr:DUF6527 family protein [Sulfitobacter pontiacus]WPZ24851.1 DUF6527 family protein [Sulfitobacter pontiacus]
MVGAVSALGSKLRKLEGGLVAFVCPGCNESHQVTVDGSRGWTFNGDGDSPTFSPSVLVRSGHYIQGHTGDCWCTARDRKGRPFGAKCFRCHSFVTDGRIRFLDDCTHDLAGQTVDLPDWPVTL